MDTDLAELNRKLDILTALVEAQNRRLEELEQREPNHDAVLSRLDTIVEHVEVQRRYQEDMAELRRDLTPVVNQFVKVTIDEMAEIGTEFQGEDLLFLLKRLLRDTHMLVNLLNTLEGAVELAGEVQRLSQPAFHQAVQSLDKMERAGYFTFARGGWQIMEKVVAEFGEDDLNALGENIVTILKTVRSMTQPQIMALANNALQAIQAEPAGEETPSLFALLRDLSDPRLRKGLARVLNMVKVLSDAPAAPNQN